MNVGEVRRVELPPRGGHAQAGRRPAIVVQTPVTSIRLSTVLIVPLTSQTDALRFPGTVLVEADKGNGLHTTSVALVFQLTAADKRFVKDRLGIIADSLLQTIWSSLDEITGRA